MNTRELLREHFYYETYYLNEQKDSPLGYKEVEFDFDERNKQFAEILFACANVDGDLSRSERNFILGSCLARGCSKHFLEHLDWHGIKDLKTAVKSFAKQYHNNMASLVYEIIKVCCSDGRFSPDEIKIVDKIAEWSAMPKETLDALKEVYREEVEVCKKLRKLCHYQ